jgi:tetratricopeptide (TPR) repeat protein
MLTLGFGWLPAYWLVVTFAYQSMRERALSIVMLVGMLAVAPLVDFHAGWSRTVLNPLFRAAVSSVSGTFEPTDVFILQRAEQTYPEDMDLQFIIASQYKNLGEYDHSASRLRTVLQGRSDDPAARVNLGNIYFTQRDWEGAILEYDQTIQARPDLAAAWFNKSLAHAENFQFREREEARARAQNLDSRAVAAHEHRTGDYRAVMDLSFDYETLKAKFYGLEQDRHSSPVFPSWIGAWVNGKGARFTYVALALAVLLLILERFGGRHNTRHCWKCGSAFCGRCQIGTGRRGFCTQCYHLFFIKDGVSAQARNEKMYQVRTAAQKRSVVFRVLSIVVPGGGHIVEGTPLWGALLLLFWVSGTAYFFMGRWFYDLPDNLMVLDSSLPTYAAVFMVLLALVLANTVARTEHRG